MCAKWQRTSSEKGPGVDRCFGEYNLGFSELVIGTIVSDSGKCLLSSGTRRLLMWSAPHSLFRSCTSRARWTFWTEAFDRYRKASYNDKKCFSATSHYQVPKFVGLMTTSSVKPLKWIAPGMVPKQLTLTVALWYVNVMCTSKYGDRNAAICIELRLMTFSQRASPSASHPLHTFRFRRSTH